MPGKEKIILFCSEMNYSVLGFWAAQYPVQTSNGYPHWERDKSGYSGKYHDDSSSFQAFGLLRARKKEIACSQGKKFFDVLKKRRSPRTHLSYAPPPQSKRPQQTIIKMMLISAGREVSLTDGLEKGQGFRENVVLSVFFPNRDLMSNLGARQLEQFSCQ